MLGPGMRSYTCRCHVAHHTVHLGQHAQAQARSGAVPALRLRSMETTGRVEVDSPRFTLTRATRCHVTLVPLVLAGAGAG